MGKEMTRSAPSPSPAEIVARWRRDPMLVSLLARLANGNENRPSVPAEIAAVLPVLVDEARMDFAPLDDDSLIGELTAVVAAIGLGASQNEKREWITAATIHLGQFPAGLCREALHESVLECDRLTQVLKFVKAYCEDYPMRMSGRLDRLERLLEISKGNAADV